MTQHPIHTLSPPELRGYARGLRETAALLGASWSHSGMVEADDISLLITATREAWRREAELVEGFAARLEEADGDQPKPVTRERVEAWVAGFEAPIQSFAAAPTEQEQAQTGLADAVAEDVAQQPTTAKPEPKKRNLTDAQREARRQSMIAMNAKRAAVHVPPPHAHPAEVVEQARAMFCAGGLTHAEIGQRLGVPTGTISGWAAKRGWADQRQPRGEALEEATAQPTAPPAQHAHSRAENGAKPDTWTAERQGLLRRVFSSTMPVEQILQEVNHLPGPLVASTGAVEAQARKLGLSRKQPPRLDGAIAPPKGSEVPPMTTEDKAEAREMLRKGKLKGARDVMEFFGCTQAEALDLVDAHRAEAAARRAA